MSATDDSDHPESPDTDDPDLPLPRALSVSIDYDTDRLVVDVRYWDGSVRPSSHFDATVTCKRSGGRWLPVKSDRYDTLKRELIDCLAARMALEDTDEVCVVGSNEVYDHIADGARTWSRYQATKDPDETMDYDGAP